MQRRARILVIDDDPDFVEATKIVLESRPYDVIVALNGDEGLKKAREERPDLALDPSNLRGLCASCHNRKTFAAALGSSLCDGPAGAPRREGGSISTA